MPKFLRERNGSPQAQTPSPSKTTLKPPSRNYNPFVVYIIGFLLIGSNAINQIGTKNDLDNYKRSTDAKIQLLKDVVQRLHKGEDVDVAAVLGTGNDTKEREWEQGMYCDV